MDSTVTLDATGLCGLPHASAGAITLTDPDTVAFAVHYNSTEIFTYHYKVNTPETHGFICELDGNIKSACWMLKFVKLATYVARFGFRSIQLS